MTYPAVGDGGDCPGPEERSSQQRQADGVQGTPHKSSGMQRMSSSKAHPSQGQRGQQPHTEGAHHAVECVNDAPDLHRIPAAATHGCLVSSKELNAR